MSGDEDLADAAKGGWRGKGVSERLEALATYAEKLTHHPSDMTEADLAPLRGAGLSDRDILDAVQVIAYFNYINRVADALGIDPEPEMRR